MKTLPRHAALYILVTLAAGLATMTWYFWDWRPEQVGLLIALSAVASIMQTLRVTGATERSSYNISWLIFAFTYSLLGAPAMMFVIFVTHAVEWIFRRYAWYLQSFNIANYMLAVLVADVAGGFIVAHPIGQLTELMASLTTMGAFTLFNHLLVGIIIWLARGENFGQSGIFDPLCLIIDLSLLCLGVVGALVWLHNPYAVILLLIPIYLVYNTLRMPALERQTDTDAKTGLFNARYFNRELDKSLAHAHRLDKPVTVVLADLDLLRNINNTYGHLAGDAVLISIAEILKRSIRSYDVVSRFGGEEFAILMPGLDPEQALGRIESMRAAIAASSFEVPTSLTPITATMSFGLAGRERANQPASELLHNADVALYNSKLAGRNRISLYSRLGPDPAATLTGAYRPLPAKASEVPMLTAADHRLPPARGEAPMLAEAVVATFPGPIQASATPRAAPSAAPPPTRPAAPSASPPIVQAPPAWWLKCYVAGVVATALLLFILAAGRAQPVAWVSLSLFALLVLLTEGFAIDIYVRDSSISTSVVPFLAGSLLFGPIGVLVLSLVVAVTAMVKHRSPPIKFLFNTHNQMLAGLTSVTLVRLLGVDASTAPALPLLGVSILASCATYATTTALTSGAIALDIGVSTRRVWRERFSWLSPYYAAFGTILFALIFSYQASGLAGVLVIGLPLILLRYSQKQFVDRTKTVVNELRATNAELLKQSQEVSRLNEELLQVLAHVIDMRDPYVSGHSQHVARYAVLIARELGLDSERLELIRKAGLLHDIGKLGIPEAILFKPGPLTPAEYKIIQQHATLGPELLSNCHSLARLVPIVREHHERYDGRGYPSGLLAEEITPEARIVGLADAIEAMASDRPYRQGMSCESIRETVQQHTGTQFDPQVVAAFLRVLDREGPGVVINSALNVKLDRLPSKNFIVHGPRPWPLVTASGG